MFFVGPTVRTRVVIRVAPGVQLVLTNLARHDVVLLVDAFGAPGTKVMIHEWAWPLISMCLEMSRVEEEITIWAVFSNNLRYGAEAVCTLR